MSRCLLALLALCCLSPLLQAQPHAGHSKRPELGSSALITPEGKLLMVSKEGEHLYLQRGDPSGQHWEERIKINPQPEAIAADGENRPKLALGADGSILVAWTKPLPKPYTGEIRFARSSNGKVFDAPITVHRDRAEITHRFESLHVLKDGRVLLAWIDKRDLEAAKASKAAYRGAAIYSAVSSDHGKSFAPEQKVADHSCECCRIAIAEDRKGQPLLFWRQVFAPNERDHALATLRADGTAAKVQRATFDRWKIDACPHHGPGLAVDADDVKHAVWFNVKEGEGRVFYGRLQAKGDELSVEGQLAIGGTRAQHADITTSGQRVAIVWKEFDGEKTALNVMVSQDSGRSFSPPKTLASSESASDQPHWLAHGEQRAAVWRTEREGLRVFPLP